jgi:hypothetical protein
MQWTVQPNIKNLSDLLAYNIWENELGYVRIWAREQRKNTKAQIDEAQ